MAKAKPLKLVRNGGSLNVRLPPEFKRANNLRPGDYVIVDLTKFKVLRMEDFELLGRELEGETEGVG
jgi:antitoxin component of MazEF toxin-antitoxin module